MKGALILTLVTPLLLSACATAVNYSDAKTVPDSRLYAFQDRHEGDAKIEVTRDRGFYGSGCAVELSINGKPVAEFRQGEGAEFYAPPGLYTMSIKTASALCPSSSDALETRFKGRNIRRYRISTGSNGHGWTLTGD